MFGERLNVVGMKISALASARLTDPFVSALNRSSPQLVLGRAKALYSSFPVVMRWSSQGRVLSERLREFFSVFKCFRNTDLCHRYFSTVGLAKNLSTPVVSVNKLQRLSLECSVAPAGRGSYSSTLSAPALAETSPAEIFLRNSAVVSWSELGLVVFSMRRVFNRQTASAGAQHGLFYFERSLLCRVA